jgi:CRISPR-associated protein Csm4
MERVMKLFKTTITPKSNFATSLKGDTLFGQLCWMIKYKYGVKRLEELLSGYNTNPFMIVSDGYVADYLLKPKLPPKLLKEDPKDKKINRKKIWLTLEELQNLEFIKARTDKELDLDKKEIVHIHNSINYQTFRTDDTGTFAPYGEKEFVLKKQDIYILIDTTQFTKDELSEIFELLSLGGYGKDITIGKGRFEFETFEEIDPYFESSFFVTLSPASIQGLECKNAYYEPFVRFGKFGADRAYKNAFKKPILLADNGAVIEFETKETKQYIGKAITDISDIYKDAVHQGYSIVLPIKELS